MPPLGETNQMHGHQIVASGLLQFNCVCHTHEMARTPFKTLCLLLANILLLLSSCILGTIIMSDDFGYLYNEVNKQVTYSLLVLNAGLSIFTFVIVQNLNDVFLHRTPSPRGVETKMKIQWILLFVVTFLYVAFHSQLFVSNWDMISWTDIAVLTIVIVFLLQSAKLVVIYQMHPDMFGLKETEDYERYVEKLGAGREGQAET